MPLEMRMVVNPIGSMAPSLNANRHRSEFPAKATSANAVATTVARTGGVMGGSMHDACTRDRSPASLHPFAPS